MRNEKGAEYRSDRVICHMCWNSGFYIVGFKKHRGVCTGNNTGSSAGTYVGTECIGFRCERQQCREQCRSYGIAGDGRK